MNDERLTPLRADMEAEGMIEGRDDDGVSPEVHASIRVGRDLEPDVRAENERCAICLWWMHPRRKVKVADGQYAHRLCAGQEQVDEWVLPKWLALPMAVRRQRLVQHYGIDPLSGDATPTEVEWVSYASDVDGLPASMRVERSTHRRVPTVGVPRCWWSVAAQGGWPT